MRVQAGDPEIFLINSTTITVQKDSSAILSTFNISADTNLNINRDDLEWFIVDEPTEGVFQVDGVKKRKWSQKDVLNGKVEFLHKPSKKNRYLDFLVIKCFYKNLESAQRKVQISIFMENYQLPLQLMKNDKINAWEGKKSAISNDEILVTHISASASEIEFEILKPPMFGKIVDNDGNKINQFTQADIIHQAVFYQSIKPAMVDVFTLNVTNQFSFIANYYLCKEFAEGITIN